MTVYLPYIGVPDCQRAKALIEEYPQNIVGSFWIMKGYGFDDKDIPDWWIYNVLEKNQAQGIINAFEKGYFEGGHNNPIYLGFCIIIFTDSSNPVNLSYMIQHLRMWEAEGIGLLELMAEHNIPAHTEITDPEFFLESRYGNDNSTYKNLRKSLEHWSVQVWEDYCSYLMSKHGKQMLYEYYKQINKIKDEVKAAVVKGSKLILLDGKKDTVEENVELLILTEGETDPIYIRTALELLKEKEILERVNIEWAGKNIDTGKSINTGESGLTNTKNVLISNPQFMLIKTLLLYDCDAKIYNEEHGNLKIRKIPQQNNRKIKVGIENLFPDHLFTKDFYIPKRIIGSYGEEIQKEEFQKIKFCKWICEERREPNDFVDFKVIIDIIKECLGKVSTL